MSVASKLQPIVTNLFAVRSAINAKLVAKGSTSADTLDDVPDKIEAIQTGGDTPVVGTPTLMLKSEYVDATRTSETEISFTGLNVANDEILAGTVLNYQGTKSTSAATLNTIVILQNGSKWDCYIATSVNGALIVGTLSENAASFVKNGANGGTVTLANGWVLLEGTYRVTPFVVKVS